MQPSPSSDARERYRLARAMFSSSASEERLEESVACPPLYAPEDVGESLIRAGVR
jgi:hypothetical protein